MTVRITPSILNANLASLSDEVGRIPSADGLHIDVMDGHFVPNLVMGAPFVASLRPTTDLMFDVHLMIEDPDRWAPQYVEAGAQSVTFHLEAATAPIKLARELRAMGARASVALRPATPVEQLAGFLTEFDQILLMDSADRNSSIPFSPRSVVHANSLTHPGRTSGCRLTAESRLTPLSALPRPGPTPSWRVLPSTDPMTPTRSSPHCAIRLRRPRTAATEYCGQVPRWRR